MPADRVAFWDFDNPALPRTERDTAAAALAPAAPLQLAAVAPEPGPSRYRKAAEAAARGLVDRHLTPTHAGDRRLPGIWTEACFNKWPDVRRARSARLEGFSLHAAVAVPPPRRDQRERLVRHLVRLPLALGGPS